ncbi:MAG TPA: hypothetical protein VI168_07980 [Croceibacterium sp.]
MLGSILCRLKGHLANRRKAWHDGIDFRSSCTRCGEAMVRDLGGWRCFTEADERRDRQQRHS